VRTRSGLRIVPDKAAASWPTARLLPAADDRVPADFLDDTLAAIGARYGRRTADVVAMQLEYPRP
jgi:hypothetical protein